MCVGKHILFSPK